MKRVCLAFVLLGLNLPNYADAQESAIEEFAVSGIRVIYKPIAANEVIAVRLYLTGGSANLTPETAGIERFIADVAPRGTDNYTKDELATRLASTGTRINAQATFDFTVATLQAVADHWDTAWDLFTQVVLHPTFPEAEVELARQQIVNQLRSRQDNPDTYLNLLANDLFYSGHAYTNDPTGAVEAVEGLTREDLMRWHRERMTKENLLFVVVGHVSREDLAEKIASAFGTLPAEGGTSRVVSSVEAGPADLEIVERELPTNYIRGQFSTPAPGHPDYPAMRVATDILRDRLFEEVRTKRNLSYAVTARLSSRQANYGMIYVTAVEPDTTLKVMLHEVDRMAHEPVSPERLRENISEFVTRYWIGQETNMGQAASLGSSELVAGSWEHAIQFAEAVQEVTPQDVQRVASEYINNIHFVVLGDPSKIDRTLFTSH